MKSEKISKINLTSIPTPNRTEKNKNIKKLNKNYSREKNVLKIKFDYSSECKLKTSSIKKLNKLEIEAGPESENRKKLNKKLGLIESNQKDNIKEKHNKQKIIKTMIKHKTSSTLNNSNNYNIKAPTMFIQNRKPSKTKITNLKTTNNNKNQKSIHSYLNKGENVLHQKYNNSYIKTSCFSTKNNLYNCNNIIYQFIENKIYLKNKAKNNSFILKNRNMTLNVGKIFCLTNNNNSAPLIIKSKNTKKPKSGKRKNIINHKNTQKLNNSKLNPKSSDNEMSFLSGQKHILQKKRNLFNKKIKKENTNDSKSDASISLFSSYMNRKKKSLYKLKTNDKILTNLKKQNISSYQKKTSVSNMSFNKERNISFLKVNQEKKKSFAANETEKEKEKEKIKEPKKDCLTTITEDKKLKKNNCFNFLHHYLMNTVSTKNKIVLKKPEDKTFSNYYQKIEKDRTSKSKSKSKSKSIKTNKRYSLFNRNCVLKTDKHAKTREDLSASKINDKIMKRTPSFGNNRILYHISNMSNLSNANSSKIFNGKIDDYLITKELGKGSYATVKLAIHKNNKNKYAIKIYSRESLLDPQKRNTIKNEINILKQLDNVNVMKLYEDINTPKFLYLVMEYINGISLLETIKKDKNHYFEEKRAIKIFIQIVKGISYCQSKNICHRDIKLENILLIENDIVKIIDFGFAVKANKETYQKLFCGTPSYMAPEIVNKEKYIAQYSDLWSLGVLFFAMLYGRFPFRAKTQEDLFQKINEANVIFPDDIEVSYKIKELLRKIFVVIPTQRISLNEILNELILLDNENSNENDN
mgnify:CR=1 FL=1